MSTFELITVWMGLMFVAFLLMFLYEIGKKVEKLEKDVKELNRICLR